MNAEKSALRSIALAKRAAMSVKSRESASAEICRRIAECPEFMSARTVMLYRAAGAEADLSGLYGYPGKRIVFPVSRGNGIMDAFEPGAWRRGLYGIWEPDPELSRIVPPEDIELIVCPCAAFDSAGGRLGMGGGYYDRYLDDAENAVVICAAFDVQRAESVPVEEHDRMMDMVVTEGKLLRF